MRHTQPDFQDMKHLIILICLLICLLGPASCQVCTTTCDHGQPLSPPAARDVIRRGKSGPRGEKGERGSTGAKGADHGEAVSRNSAVLAEHGAEIAVMGRKLESQNGVISRQEETISRQEETISRQEETIRNLSGVVRGQAAAISHLSDVVEEALSCELPVIQGATANTSSVRVAHNTVVEFSCVNYKQEGDALRKCRGGALQPSFDANAFSCTMRSLKWHAAREFCRDHGSDLLMNGIATTSERRKFCETNSMPETNILIGITKESTGIWRFADGRPLPSQFQLEWYPGYPASNRNWDYMLMICSRGSLFGKVFNHPSDSYNFACQN